MKLLVLTVLTLTTSLAMATTTKLKTIDNQDARLLGEWDEVSQALKNARLEIAGVEYRIASFSQGRNDVHAAFCDQYSNFKNTFSESEAIKNLSQVAVILPDGRVSKWHDKLLVSQPNVVITHLYCLEKPY